MVQSNTAIQRGIRKLQRRLHAMQADLDAMQAQIDPDLVLTKEEERLLSQSRRDHRAGKLLSAKQMLRELGG